MVMESSIETTASYGNFATSAAFQDLKAYSKGATAIASIGMVVIKASCYEAGVSGLGSY